MRGKRMMPIIIFTPADVPKEIASAKRIVAAIADRAALGRVAAPEGCAPVAVPLVVVVVVEDGVAA
eukprot:CAMPEP_0172536970 /NCGR_PEP_ID=MMETSP1067-20121228/8673_1 /TAXON_ID=265564 ORGANISM="Thalassiosira punctigera, Strain Tpunct2005C2" /NCGR_SAMPLE_ID=MMETSP1067 /ASSEMBLY_ACC=CAM_ASM_000444 /LENGTH=65 /DNA_ID=CAMNT_0013322165 /DNA_START=14 /DNA_END=208 /DNA_ORIENTATION=+